MPEDRAALYIQRAKEMEAKYGVRISVVRKREATQQSAPWMTGPDHLCMYVIEPRSRDAATAHQISKELEKDHIYIQGAWPAQELTRFVREKPEMMRSWLGGMGILTPFMFNDELYGGFAREVRTQFRTAFGETLKKAIRERTSRFREAMKQLHESERLSHIKQRERMEKLIGRIERKELVDTMAAMAKATHKSGASILIAFDRSGRPVGIMLRRLMFELYGKRLPLYFCDPTILKSGLKPAMVETFKHEYPTLVKHLSGANVALIDDQIWNGNSAKGMKDLVESLGAKKTAVHVLSIYPAEPPPSWRHLPGLGIETVKDRFRVKKADEKTEPHSTTITFRKRLKRLAHLSARIARRKSH